MSQVYKLMRYSRKRSFTRLHFKKKVYTNVEELQKDLDGWIEYYKHHRMKQGKMCYSRTPMKTFYDGLKIRKENKLDASDKHN